MIKDYCIKGVKLNDYDMMHIAKYYEASCTAEYLMENYDEFEAKYDDAMEAAYVIRYLMDKYSFKEEEAIEEYFHRKADMKGE